jgi:predicted RNA-binding protein YlxR (DUF448 family)
VKCRRKLHRIAKNTEKIRSTVLDCTGKLTDKSFFTKENKKEQKQKQKLKQKQKTKKDKDKGTKNNKIVRYLNT